MDKILIGEPPNQVEIVLTGIQGRKASLGFRAPAEIKIKRAYNLSNGGDNGEAN